MAFDKAHKETDKILKRTEKNIKYTYNAAYKEVKSDMESIMSKLNLDPTLTPQERLNLSNKYDRLNQLSKEIAEVVNNANKEAVKYINGQSVDVYKMNYEQEADRLFGFDKLNNTAIKQVIAGNENPFTKLAYKDLEDKVRLQALLQRDLTTSLLKGESIPNMAKRLKGTIERSMADSVRIARTETTRIEAAARIDVGKQGEKLGFVMMKEWVATSDDRTREEHLEANGQIVPIDEPFVVGGEDMMYPGDWSMGASASNTINCRCTVINKIKE